MKVEEFKNWLSSRHINDSSNIRSQCNKVENYEGDLDKFYLKDNGISILKKLTYSTKDERNNRLNSTKIPIEKSLREVLASLKKAINIYFQFCDYFEIQKVSTNDTLSNDDKEILVKYRLCQGKYRNDLIGKWKGCSVTGIENKEVLIASHIKPFSECDEDEKYDVFNGLLLSPNYDKLFDRNLISFNSDGQIILSKSLSPTDLTKLNISKNDSIEINENHEKYLKVHRKRLK